MTERCPTCGNAVYTWPRTAIIDAIQRWQREHGEPPRTPQWTKAGPYNPSVVTLVQKFGSWNAAIEAAGLTPHRRLWSREETIAAIFQWNYDHGRLPKRQEWLRACPDLSRPTAGTCARLFGTWSEAIRQAGFPPPRPSATGQRQWRKVSEAAA